MIVPFIGPGRMPRISLPSPSPNLPPTRPRGTCVGEKHTAAKKQEASSKPRRSLPPLKQAQPSLQSPSTYPLRRPFCCHFSFLAETGARAHVHVSTHTEQHPQEARGHTDTLTYIRITCGGGPLGRLVVYRSTGSEGLHYAALHSI